MWKKGGAFMSFLFPIPFPPPPIRVVKMDCFSGNRYFSFQWDEVAVLCLLILFAACWKREGEGESGAEGVCELNERTRAMMK